MTIRDNTNELKELIAEYGKIRVELMDKIYPNTNIRKIEKHLDNWKEESLVNKEKRTDSWAYNLGYVCEIGDFFKLE